MTTSLGIIPIMLKILHKGLILVAVPLIFGSAFITLLCFSISDLDRLVQREHLLKDVISCHMAALRCAAAAKRLANAYNFTDVTPDKTVGTNVAQVRNAIWQLRLAQVINGYRQEAADFDKHIAVLLQSEPTLLNSALKSTSLQLVSNSSSRYVADSHFLHELLRESDIQTKAARNAMDSVYATLYGSILLSGFISIVLAIYFCLNITNRLLIILQNTVSLSTGSKLSPPLQGTDEISELDQFLYKSANEIRELERFKHEMIGVVSHELKSPLSSVGSFLSSLGAGVYGALPEKSLTKAARTYKSVQRLMGLVADLLYLDRLELEMKPEEMNVDDLIATSIDCVKELTEQAGIEIIVKTQGGKLYADRDRLVQVLINLLSNAMKYSPDKGKVTISTSHHEGWFECRVSDEGRGIPESFRNQIFEPFKQVDATDATTKKGTGLGLTISRSIVVQHGGTIGVDSEPEKGSTFWIKIPATESEFIRSVRETSNTDAAQLSLGQAQFGMLKGNRKFSVMRQGMVMISVPLIFQVSFCCFILNSLNKINEQIQHEETSTEILNTLNRGAEYYFSAMYAFSNNNPDSWKRCLNDQKQVFGVLDKVEKLCSDDHEEQIDSQESRRCLRIFYDSLQKLTASLENQTASHAVGSSSGPAQNATSDPATVKEIYPLFEAQKAEEKLMLREREIGEKLGADRLKMIKDLSSTLRFGVVANFLLSLYLAVMLLRKLRRRLKHVKENTARLVRREKLAPPISSGDEIAYLDRVLYDAGNHLLELEKFKQELISIVSHELRTPLLAISSALELFEMEVLGELTEKGKNRLKIACEEADRLIRLINDLLDIEKMEAGKFILDYSEINVTDLIQTAIASVAPPADAKAITLRSNVPNADMTVWGDRDRLCQVLINLLSNAIKFSPENESIDVMTELNGQNELKFCVIDHGRGIPEETQQKIFDRFVQVEKADETVRGGSGLGLAISRAIVEQHGGKIGVDSELGAGSTFWFKLPVKQYLTDKKGTPEYPCVR